jgi:hypothetical protein
MREGAAAHAVCSSFFAHLVGIKPLMATNNLIVAHAKLVHFGRFINGLVIALVCIPFESIATAGMLQNSYIFNVRKGWILQLLSESWHKGGENVGCEQ